MANLTKVVIELRRERDAARKRVEQLDQPLTALGSLDGLRKPGRASQKFGTTRRTMSAEARKRIAPAQRGRWAKWKAKHKKTGIAS